LRISCADPDSNDVAFGVAPRINAAGRIDHPARALSVFEAAKDGEAACSSVERLDQLNQQRRQLAAAHFEGLCAEVPHPVPPALVYQINQLLFVTGPETTLKGFKGTLYGYIAVYKQHERSNKDIMPIQLILE